MKYESGETESPEIKLSEFQNPIFTEPKNILPELRHITDAKEAEAGEAPVRRDFSGFSKFQNDIFVDPRDTNILSEFRYTAEASETGADAAEAPVRRDFSGFKFQNDSFGIKVDDFEKYVPESSGDYCGPSTDALDIKIENAVKDLTFAQEQLARALATGTGVITAMSAVESAQKLLDSYEKQYAQAVAGEARQAAENVSAKSDEAGEVKLGSVSHATWELEQAYKSGNSIRIHNAERNLAHEKAKEAAKE